MHPPAILNSALLLFTLAMAPCASAAPDAPEAPHAAPRVEAAPVPQQAPPPAPQWEVTGRRIALADDSKRLLAIVEPDGRISWRQPVGPIHDLHVLDNGHVLFQKDFKRIVEMAPDGRVVWSYDASQANGNAGKPVEVHAFQRLADGRTMIAESGPARIIEVDAQGRVQHELKLKVNHPHPHRDTRLARKLPGGNYLVCHEGDGAVREYRPTGEVAWEYDVPLFGKPRRGGHGVDAWGNQVYGALRLPSGNTLIATGNGHSVIEVTPSKEIVWHLKQDELPGIRLAWVTTLQVLSNGHIVIGNCHAGPGNPQVIEIDRAKRVVWRFRDFERFGDSLPTSQVLGLGAPSLR